MTEQEIKSLTCKKHIKIFKLKELGMENKKIAEQLGTNVGHVYNVLKNYREKPELIEKANAINNVTIEQ